jgi:hypothetical protein
MKSRTGSSIGFLILIPPNFDDKLVLNFLGSFRKAGLSSALVSLTSGLIKSANDVWVRADFSIDQLPETTLARFVFILENQAGAAALLADPRIHQLLDRTLAAKGMLVLLSETQALFQAAGFSEGMIVPESVKTKPFMLRVFVDQLVSLLPE